MEKQNLQTVSTYINNVLLARGLLKGGRPIDFVYPENEEGGTDATMARIINLVNDMVVRRDREAEHRENVATTIRTMRANESQQTLENERLRTRMSDLTRSLALAEAQDRTLKANVSNAEATIRGLKEQLQRMKNTVQQVRAQCANDIRKRDLEMQKLRLHLADRQRGRRDGIGVTTININSSIEREPKSKVPTGGEGVNEPGYSLRQETTEFLTELCQNLSDENDALIGLSRNTVQTLKDLQGLPNEEEMDHSGGSSSVATQQHSQGPVTTLAASHEELSTEMDSLLNHLRTLLTNPSFVPLEEVEVRDKEISQLRESWENMENNWKQAVTMMDGWHQRISDGGDSVQADELQMGLNLDPSTMFTKESEIEGEAGAGASTASVSNSEQTEQAKGISRERAPKRANSNDPELQTKERKIARVSNRALKERNENSKLMMSPRKVSFKPSLRGSPCDNDKEDDKAMLVKAHKTDSVTQRPSRNRSDAKATSKDSTTVS